MNNSSYLVVSQPLSMKYSGIHKKSFGFLLLVSLCNSIDSYPLLAMYEEEDPTESTRLRQTAQYVQPSWWQSVEVIRPRKEWKNGRTDGAQKWELSPTYVINGGSGICDVLLYCCSCSCCCSNLNDLVTFREDKREVMLRRYANEIMRAENEEISKNFIESEHKKSDAQEAYRKLKFEQDVIEKKLYESQLPKLNRHKAEYDGRDYPELVVPAKSCWVDEDNRKQTISQLRKLGVCDKIIEELTEATKNRKEREKKEQVEYNKPENQLKRQEEALEKHRKALEANTREQIRLREELAKVKK